MSFSISTFSPIASSFILCRKFHSTVKKKSTNTQANLSHIELILDIDRYAYYALSEPLVET